MKLPQLPTYLDPTTEDFQRTDAINVHVPGWSNPNHYCFFRTMLERFPIKSVLMLGVYHGRDLAYIEDIQKRLMPGRGLNLVGVDLFEAGPMQDWPEHCKNKTWQEMGFGPNPSEKAATINAPSASIVKSNSIEYLKGCLSSFDLIYFDTSHDENTLRDELRACVGCVHSETLLSGDDYNDNPNWGVKRVVDRSFKDKRIYPPIWLSSVELLKPNA